MSGQANTVVVGLGNEFRRDDGFGPAVVRALDGRIPPTTTVTTVTDATDLLDAWAGRQLAIVVDLVLPDLIRPGRVQRWVLGDDAGPLDSHGIDVAAALALAHALGTAPGHAILYATASRDVGFGQHLSPPVRRAVEVTTDAIAAEVTSGLRIE
ncbi:hydrogenase maturation protease [Rhodococcus hoagii]|nr:hydrogenase maturation protease [Prescottella equi]